MAGRKSDAEPLLDEELLAGERVLWKDVPDPGRHLSPGDAYLVPFSVLWGGGASLAVLNSLGVVGRSSGDHEPLLISLSWGVPFLLVAFYVTIGRFIYKARRKRRTLYVVTDARVITLETRRNGRRVQAAFVGTLPSVHKTIRKDGSGSVVFGNSPWWGNWYANTGLDVAFLLGGGEGRVAFYDVVDAAQVARIVEQARRGGEG